MMRTKVSHQSRGRIPAREVGLGNLRSGAWDAPCFPRFLNLKVRKLDMSHRTITPEAAYWVRCSLRSKRASGPRSARVGRQARLFRLGNRSRAGWSGPFVHDKIV